MRDLLTLVRESIQEELVNAVTCDLEPYKELYKQKQGAFVTLRIQSALRGCIGAITPTQPLYITIYEMAKKAAFNDYRFKPLSQDEFTNIRIELSVLSEIYPVPSSNDIVLGTHGIILSNQNASAIFLPEVATEQNWDKTTCLEHLSQKAGLDKDAWKTAQFEVFTSEHFSE